jgi:preprotein translocase subunit SecF
MRIFENPNYRFIQSRKRAYIFSGLLILASIASIAIHGLELGIDFKGGMEFVVQSDNPLEVTAVRSALAGILDTDPEVKTYGPSQLLIRTLSGSADINTVESKILDGIAAAFPDSNPEVEKTDIVGPRFAEDLKEGAIFSIFGSLLVIFVYILLRFEWRFGVGAVAALFHDVLITLGTFALLHGILPFSLQIDQTIIAAFLTIVGYSLNDTVVVFDRIREYTGIFKSEKYEDVVNKSINNTLSRTLITSGTTLLVVAVLFIFGGEVLRGFAFALIIGILIGTYSSIFVASPVVIELKARAGAKR